MQVVKLLGKLKSHKFYTHDITHSYKYNDVFSTLGYDFLEYVHNFYRYKNICSYSSKYNIGNKQCFSHAFIIVIFYFYTFL